MAKAYFPTDVGEAVDSHLSQRKKDLPKFHSIAMPPSKEGLKKTADLLLPQLTPEIIKVIDDFINKRIDVIHLSNIPNSKEALAYTKLKIY